MPQFSLPNVASPVSAPLIHRPARFAAQIRPPAPDRLELRFGGRPAESPTGLSDAQKRDILKQAPVVFADGADFKKLAGSPEEAAELARATLLDAFGEALVAGEPKVRGPLPEGWGAAAVVDTGQKGQRVKLSDSNITFRTDTKMCAEQNLLDRVIKHPEVRQGEKPKILLLGNVLQNFDQARYRDSYLTPCNTCLDTFQSIMKTRKDLLRGDTLIASLAVKTVDGQPRYQIELRPLKRLLPAANLQGPSFSTTPIPELPVVYTNSAKKLMAQRAHGQIGDDQVRATMQSAMEGFAASALNGWSARGEQYAGVGLMLYPDEPGAEPRISRGSSLHIKNSEAHYAELDALAAALREHPVADEARIKEAAAHPDQLEALTRPKGDSHLKSKQELPALAGGLSLVGLVHRLSDQPRPRLLGLLKDAARQDDFLVAQIRNDRIVVLTANQILPIQYKAAARSGP